MRTRIDQRSPYTACMFRAGIVLTLACTLAACGMKGDLYLPPEAPAESGTAPVPAEAGQTGPDQAEAEADKGERRTIPATPSRSLSR